MIATAGSLIQLLCLGIVAPAAIVLVIIALTEDVNEEIEYYD